MKCADLYKCIGEKLHKSIDAFALCCFPFALPRSDRDPLPPRILPNCSKTLLEKHSVFGGTAFLVIERKVLHLNIVFKSKHFSLSCQTTDTLSFLQTRVGRMVNVAQKPKEKRKEKEKEKGTRAKQNRMIDAKEPPKPIRTDDQIVLGLPQIENLEVLEEITKVFAECPFDLIQLVARYYFAENPYSNIRPLDVRRRLVCDLCLRDGSTLYATIKINHRNTFPVYLHDGRGYTLTVQIQGHVTADMLLTIVMHRLAQFTNRYTIGFQLFRRNSSMCSTEMDPTIIEDPAPVCTLLEETGNMPLSRCWNLPSPLHLTFVSEDEVFRSGFMQASLSEKTGTAP
jgi:hypothetical protein